MPRFKQSFVSFVNFYNESTSKPFLITCSGVASSGKTTFVDYLSEILENEFNLSVRKICNTARSVLFEFRKEYGFPDTDNLSDVLSFLRQRKRDYSYFQFRIINRWIKEVNDLLTKDTYNIILCDRSYLDFAIYTLLYCGFDEMLKIFSSISFPEINLKIYCESVGFVEDDVRLKDDYNRENYFFEELVKPVCQLVLPNISLSDRLSLFFNYFAKALDLE